jgi:hypothetical protein
MEIKIQTTDKNKIELAAENLVQILIQQAMSDRNNLTSKKIENKYGKSN